MYTPNPLKDQTSKQPGSTIVEQVAKQDAGVGMRRKWECHRCKDPINILAPDSEKRYVIDGDKIFCCKRCKMEHAAYIPVDPARKKLNVSKKHRSQKHKEAWRTPIFKCFNCEHETNIMTHDKLCPRCARHWFIDNPGEAMNNAFKSLIRLSKMN